MLLKKCYRCIDLHTGAFSIAVFGLLGALGIGLLGNMFQGSRWVALFAMIAVLAAHGCLIVGAIHYNPGATLIHLKIGMLGIILHFTIAMIALVLIVQHRSGYRDPRTCYYLIEILLPITVGLAIPVGILDIYLWKCAYSIYRELKMSEEMRRQILHNLFRP